MRDIVRRVMLAAGWLGLLCTFSVAWSAEPPLDAQVAEWLAPGRAAAQAGDYAKAQQLTRAAFERADKVIARDHWARAYLFNDLARWKAASGQHAAALIDAKSAFDIARIAFSGQAQRIAYFALDLGVLSFREGDCAAAREVLSASLDSAVGSSLRNELALALARVLWATGDVPRAREVARSIEAVPEAQLVIALLDIDAGQHARARLQLDHYRKAQSLGSDLGRWPEGYLEAELSYALATGDLGNALQRAQAFVARAQAQADPRLLAAAHHRHGQVLSLMGRFAEAERAFATAQRGIEGPAGEAATLASNVYHDLAWTYRLVGDYPRSEYYFERALTSAAQCSGSFDQMPILMRRERAMLRMDQGKFSEALADVDAAGKALGTLAQDTRVLRGLLLATRSFVLDKLGERAEAASTMRAALDLIRAAEGATSINLPLGQLHLAELALRSKDLATARQLAAAAMGILDARNAESIWGTGGALSIRAATHQRTPAAYWSDAQRFLGVIERSLAGTGVPSSANQSEIQLARLQTERLLAYLPSDFSQRLPLLGRLLQVPHVSDATASVQIAALEASSIADDTRQLVRRRGELLERAQALRTALMFAQQRGQSDPAAVVQLTTLMEQLAQTDAALLRSSPEVAGQLLQRSIDVAEVQKRLRPREALLIQVVGETAVHAMLVLADRLVFRTTPLSRDELRADVQRLRLALDLSLPPAERRPFNPARAHAIYRAALGAFDGELRQIDELIAIADDALQSIPWSVLVDRLDGEGLPESFVVDRLAVTTMPSMQSFVALRDAPARARAARPFVAFADPRMDTFREAARGASARGGIAALPLAIVSTLPELPDTAREALRMATLLGASRRDVYLAERATERAVRAADLSQYRIVTFATHGLMAGEAPGLTEPALVLTREGGSDGTPEDDGLLTASEIAQLTVRADLVVLSACNTGRIDPAQGVRGISGLARGFFAAGGRALLLSHWSVASESTALLLAKVVEVKSADPRLGNAAALRRAMLWMKGADAPVDFRAPEFWGAFVVVGENFSPDT